MRIATTLILTLLITRIAYTQNQIGIFAGPQATAARYTILNQKQKIDAKYGFQAGLTLKTPFEGKLSFAPAVFYSLKGYDVTFTEFRFPPDTLALNNNTSIHCFEIAPMLQYDMGSGPGHVFIKAGPSIDLQLKGSEKYDLKTGGSVSRDMKFAFDSYGHFSANLLLILGYETATGFFLFGQYTHGAGSINNFDGGPKIRHRAYGLSIGKYFNGKK